MAAKDFDKSKLWARRENAKRSVQHRPLGGVAAPEGNLGPSDSATTPSALLESPHQENMLDRYRARLSAQYRLDSEYLSVGQIARILGLSPSAIHADMRSGRFFLPYRLFDLAPKIFIDDLVEWRCSGHGVVPACCGKTAKETPLDSNDTQEHNGANEDAQGDAEMDATAAKDTRFRSTVVDPRELGEHGRHL